MKKVGCRNQDGSQRVLKAFFILYFLCFISLVRAEEFGDVSVSAAAMFTGNTYHGYAEMRVHLENHSTSKTHVVTLAYPKDSSYGSGNRIGQLTRSVRLEPGAREVVFLLQPPLPVFGSGAIRVTIDRNDVEVRAPNANNHCNSYSRGNEPATLFVSRNLDYDAVSGLFNANRGAFTAAMAVGAPDASGRGAYQPTSWMPDTHAKISSHSGRTNWLELDYATPLIANKIFIYSTTAFNPAQGEIILQGISGTNIAHVPMSFGTTGTVSSGRETLEFSFPETHEPVKTIRLDFENMPPSNIAIDAVQIFGEGKSQFASAARASSDNSASAGSYSPGSAAADTVQSLRAESPVSEWSENWLAYTPFDAIALDDADLNSMPPAVLNAVGDYLHAGGNIFLSSKTGLPAVWHPMQQKKISDGVEYQIGFGRCYVFPSENFALTKKTAQTLRDAIRESALYYQSLPQDSVSANSLLPVVNNLKIPVRGIVVIMLAFIIIIGPVNIIYLNRRKRRTWMLWTIPAISFATTLLVFAYSLLREGITPDTRITGITFLDQASHRAATIGGTAFYCPLTPSGGLTFNFETEATPLVQSGYYGNSGSSREVDWTQSQHFTHGWVSARVPAYFHLRKPDTRRERVQIVNEGGHLQAVNSLGANIKSLWFADAKMNFYQAGNIAAGQKGALILSQQSLAPGNSDIGALWRDAGFAAREETASNAMIYIQPNTYIAVLEGNPFIENALGSAASPKRTKSSAIVFGILEAGETK